MTRLPAWHQDDDRDLGNCRLRWQVKPAAVYYVTPAASAVAAGGVHGHY